MTAKARTYKRGKTFAPEVRLAPGPRAMGDTGDGSYTTLFGYAWAAVLDRVERRFRLFQAQVPGEGPWALNDPRGPEVAIWVEVAAEQPPHPVDRIAHLGLAFDQAAREVIAYEVDGQVYVRQWDPFSQQYVIRGPFAGHDPVLTVDALMAGVENSDVLLFHLGQDRKRIIMRVQRERYLTPHVVHDGETPLVLDQAVITSWRVELLGSPLSALDQSLAWLSNIYPVRRRPGIAIDAELAEGRVKEAIVRSASALLSLSSSLAEGTLSGSTGQTLVYSTLGRVRLAGQLVEGAVQTGLVKSVPVGGLLLMCGIAGGSFQAAATYIPLGRLRLNGVITGGSLT